jgi:hypothetical protein
MAETHVISALKRKRAVIAGELAKAEKRCNAMRDYLAALNNTLRIFGYDGDPADIQPIRPTWRLFRRGELPRAIMAILRAANGPMTNAELAQRVISMNGWDAADAALTRKVAGKIRDVRKRLAP